MLVKVKTIEQLKQEFFFSLRNNCGDKITKITPLSVTNGFAFAISKIVQKLNKDAAMIEAKLFPETANSTVLDNIASREGVPGRRSSSGSSTVLLFFGALATVYPAGTQVRSIGGVIFETLEELTLSFHRFGFVLAESTTVGSSVNVSPNTVTELVAAPPAGHTSVTNPFRAIGGRDQESDYDFRNRLLQAENIISKNTEAFYEALVYNVTEDILRVHSRGLKTFDDTFELIVVKNNLADYDAGELAAIKNGILNSVPLSDYGDTKISVANIDWTYIDMYIPIRLISGYNLEDVAVQMQAELATFIDLSRWRFGEKVEWDDLLEVCKNTEGVQEIYDRDFLPRVDKTVGEHSLPRIRQFTIKDIPSDTTFGNVFTPAFWNGTIVNNYYVQILNQTTGIE